MRYNGNGIIRSLLERHIAAESDEIIAIERKQDNENRISG